MAPVPAARSKVRTHPLAYVSLAALFLLSVAHWTRDAFDNIDVVRHATEYIRDPFELDEANRDAISLQPEAVAAGLKSGDAVLAVNGRPLDGFVVYYSALRRARAGDRLSVQVRYADPQRDRDARQDVPDDARGGGAERAADADFRSPSVDGVRGDTVSQSRARIAAAQQARRTIRRASP